MLADALTEVRLQPHIHRTYQRLSQAEGKENQAELARAAAITPSRPTGEDTLGYPLQPKSARNHLVITHLFPACTGKASCRVNGLGVPSA